MSNLNNQNSTLRIGFAKKYYTLWNVINTLRVDVVEGVSYHSEHTTYEFVKNLSTSERLAIKKATDLGITNFEIDTELKGQSRTFVRDLETYSVLDTDKIKYFTIGRYAFQMIETITDIKHLIWFYNSISKNQVYVNKVLIKAGYLYELNGELVNEDDYENAVGFKQVLERMQRNDNHIKIQFTNKNYDKLYGRYTLNNGVEVYFDKSLLNEVHNYDTEWILTNNLDNKLIQCRMETRAIKTEGGTEKRLYITDYFIVD